MKVLIIAPVADGMSNPKAYPPMGLYYVMAILNRYRPNWEVKICDMNHDKLLDYQYDVFLIGINIVQVLITKEIIKYIRRNNPHAYIILGGAMAPYLLNEYGSLGEDLIYSGEATKELISVLEKRTRRFYCATIKPQLRLGLPQIEEIVLKYNSYDQGAKSFSYIYSRGCPFNCSFCSKGVLRHESKIIRYTSEMILEDDFLRIYNNSIKHIRLWDDNIGLNKLKDQILLNKISRFNFTFDCQIRSEYATIEFINKLKKHGCTGVRIGFESFSDQILKIIDKNTSTENHIKAILNCRTIGLPVRGLFIIGLPGETQETINETMNVIEKYNLSFTASIYCPYPGSSIWDNPTAYDIKFCKNEILQNAEKAYYSKSGNYNCFVETSKMSRADILKGHQMIYDLFPELTKSEGERKRYN